MQVIFKLSSTEIKIKGTPEVSRPQQLKMCRTYSDAKNIRERQYKAPPPLRGLYVGHTRCAECRPVRHTRRCMLRLRYVVSLVARLFVLSGVCWWDSAWLRGGEESPRAREGGY